jgi:hypothetical protein
LEDVGEVVKKDEQAALLCTIERCRWKREQGDLVASKELLTETQRLVQAYSGIVETEIQSHLYLAAMEYYKTKVCVVPASVCVCVCVFVFVVSVCVCFMC